MVHLGNDWDQLLAKEFSKEYYQTLRQFLRQEYATQAVYPPMQHIFEAFKRTSYQSTKVLLLGQDPYHGKGQAMGMSFSVPAGKSIPPSLRNIFVELSEDIGGPSPKSGDLSSWAAQGVLLLNAVLTVRASQPNSHAGQGWEAFTDEVIRLLDRKDTPVCFVLWGSYAQKKALLIQNPIHKILKSSHPSPFSANRGFLGSRPFSAINQFLEASGQAPIDWRLP